MQRYGPRRLERNVQPLFGYHNNVRFSWATCRDMMKRKECVSVTWWVESWVAPQVVHSRCSSFEPELWLGRASPSFIVAHSLAFLRACEDEEGASGSADISAFFNQCETGFVAVLLAAKFLIRTGKDDGRQRESRSAYFKKRKLRLVSESSI